MGQKKLHKGIKIQKFISASGIYENGKKNQQKIQKNNGGGEESDLFPSILLRSFNEQGKKNTVPFLKSTKYDNLHTKIHLMKPF